MGSTCLAFCPLKTDLGGLSEPSSPQKCTKEHFENSLFLWGQDIDALLVKSVENYPTKNQNLELEK